jgi:AAHS family 4-hydroxybenzoate transporter-like MFS transporter
MAAQREIDIATLIERPTLAPLQRSVVAWLCALMLIEGYDMQVMAYAAPAILKEWDVSRAVFGPVLSANLIGYLFGALGLTTLGDIIGRKKIIIFGALLFGSFTLATAFATSLTELIVFRIIAGLGLGAAVPTGIALVAEYVPAKRRGAMIGLMFVGYTLGAAAGGFLAAWLIPRFGWPSVFLVGGIAPLPLCLGLALALPESIRFLILSGKPVLAVVRRLQPEAADATYVVREETRHGFPVFALFYQGRAVMTALLWFAMITSFMGHQFLTGWLPTIMADSGLSISVANSIGAIFQVGGAAGSFLVGRWLDRWGIAAVVAAFLFAALFIAPIGVMTGAGALLVALVFVSGFFVLGGQIGLNSLSGTLYPSAMRASGAGWALGIGRIGSFFGPILGGILLTAGLSHGLLFLLAALPLIACAGALMVLLETRKRDGLALRPAGGLAH